MRKKWIKTAICLLAFTLAGMFCCLDYGRREKMVWESIAETEETVSDKTDAQTWQEAEGTQDTEGTQEIETEKKICVHICGSVNRPGVYEIKEGSRIYELLAMAGGAAEDGMPDAVNLADILTDGERIVIPSKEEASVMAQKEQEDGEGLVNLNTASKEQLMTLPGIGEAKAADIIKYRESNGDFQETADIMKISGIKEALFQKIQDRITV